MSLQQYVRQLRPRTEKYIPPIDKIQNFLSEAAKGINIEVISTSEIKISVLIASDYKELAVRSLHSAFGLDAN